MNLRLDSHLVAEGLVTSRSKAAHLIRTGAVTVNGEVVTKQSRIVRPGDAVDLEPFLFVGRGGYKLQAALEGFRVGCRGIDALDIGCSEGGFTDCLLRNGAASVTAVDIAEDALNPLLREDRRVRFVAGVDAADREELASAVQGRTFPLAVMDVTGETLADLLPAVSPRIDDDGALIALLKPQYETGKDPVREQEREESLRAALGISHKGLGATDWMDSPLRGGSKNRGNREFLLLFSR